MRLEETNSPEMTCIVTWRGWSGAQSSSRPTPRYSMEQLIDPDWLTDRMLCAGN